MSADLPPPLLFAGREARLVSLDALARKHWLGGLTHSQGSLEPRLSMLAELRAALCAGHLPAGEDWRWPAAAPAHAAAGALAALGLPHYCAGRQELADTVVLSLLFHLDLIVDYQDRGAGETAAVQMAIDAFSDDWRERCGLIDELTDVLGVLPDDGKNMNWDQLRGLLRSSGWQEVQRIRRLLAQLPELAQLIRALGRSRATLEELPVERTQIEQMQETVAPHLDSREQRVPDMPGETRGIDRSDRVARMLPAEAMLLGHPRLRHLRLVWHARRAERTLLVYEDDDRMRETRQVPTRVCRPCAGPGVGKRREQGPMLVCVDTSGSMQGGAEAVAKAVVLEAMRTAHAQRRPCHVIAFGGPDELLELELSPDTAGIAALAGFLGQAFRGGTDICGPLEKCLTRLEETRWQLADLLIASDGEFGATPAVVARLEAIKRDCGLRVQGVLIGDRETLGLLEVCDHIFPVREWRRLNKAAGTAAEAPVHTHRLTALYFPGALRNGETRAATVTPDVAASMWRTGKRKEE